MEAGKNSGIFSAEVIDDLIASVSPMLDQAQRDRLADMAKKLT